VARAAQHQAVQPIYLVAMERQETLGVLVAAVAVLAMLQHICHRSLLVMRVTRLRVVAAVCYTLSAANSPQRRVVAVAADIPSLHMAPEVLRLGLHTHWLLARAVLAGQTIFRAATVQRAELLLHGLRVIHDLAVVFAPPRFGGCRRLLAIQAVIADPAAMP
jgi:hypothetical protein